MKKYTLILIASVLAFAITSCGVLVPNSATVEIVGGANTTAVGANVSSDLEFKDITFVGFTEDKKFSLKEDKSKKITLNWFGDGTKTFTITYKVIATPNGGGTANETYMTSYIGLSNFEDIKTYLVGSGLDKDGNLINVGVPQGKPLVEKLKK